jgi:hypothetical protein
MAERLNLTTAAGEGAAFAPAGEIILQIKAEDRKAKALVLARVDAAAPFTEVGTLQPSLNAVFLRLPKFTEVKVQIVSNTAGKRIQVWDNA